MISISFDFVPGPKNHCLGFPHVDCQFVSVTPITNRI